MLFTNGEAVPAFQVRVGDHLSLSESGKTTTVRKLNSLLKRAPMPSSLHLVRSWSMWSWHQIYYFSKLWDFDGCWFVNSSYIPMIFSHFWDPKSRHQHGPRWLVSTGGLYIYGSIAVGLCTVEAVPIDACSDKLILGKSSFGTACAGMDSILRWNEKATMLNLRCPPLSLSGAINQTALSNVGLLVSDLETCIIDLNQDVESWIY